MDKMILTHYRCKRLPTLLMKIYAIWLKLKILVLWISRSLLDLFFANLQINSFFKLISRKMYKVHLIRVLFAEAKQLIRSIQWANSYWSETGREDQTKNLKCPQWISRLSKQDYGYQTLKFPDNLIFYSIYPLKVTAQSINVKLTFSSSF